MKKIIIMLLTAIVMTVSLTACGGKTGSDKDTSKENNSQKENTYLNQAVQKLMEHPETNPTDFVYSIDTDENDKEFIRIEEYIGKDSVVVIPAEIENIKDIRIYYFNTPETEVTDLRIPGTATIYPNAFSYNTSLKTVVIDDGVTKIPQNLFEGCEKLSTVVLPNSVDEIENYAFSEATSLKEIKIPNKVTKLCNSVFRCITDARIELGDNISEIDMQAFLETKDSTIVVKKGSLTEKTIDEYLDKYKVYFTHGENNLTIERK